jgi:hydrogenase nickel incorporation protein HypA/HybF
MNTMHEYPITLEIIRIAEEAAARANAAKVNKITVVAGEYSGFIPESVMMYFEEISSGTGCEGALLEIRRVRAKLRCSKCGELFERKPFSFSCPLCGGDGGPTATGREFYVESIEVDEGIDEDKGIEENESMEIDESKEENESLEEDEGLGIDGG